MADATLRPGRHELLCNLPGHHAAAMYTELDVTWGPRPDAAFLPLPGLGLARFDGVMT